MWSMKYWKDFFIKISFFLNIEITRWIYKRKETICFVFQLVFKKVSESENERFLIFKKA